MKDTAYSALFFAFSRCSDHHGAAAARKVLMDHGSDDGTVDSVPPERMAAATKALTGGAAFGRGAGEKSGSDFIDAETTAAIYERYNQAGKKRTAE
jgi:hypothetical protein